MFTVGLHYFHKSKGGEYFFHLLLRQIHQGKVIANVTAI